MCIILNVNSVYKIADILIFTKKKSFEPIFQTFSIPIDINPCSKYLY